MTAPKLTKQEIAETASIREAVEKHYVPKTGGINNLILKTSSSIIIYFVVILGIYLFMAGHNQPGGGFIAGLMFSGGAVLLYVCFGQPFAKNMHFDYKLLIPIGLLFALGTGLGGVVLGYPFLTHTFGHVSIPFFGEFELATASLFDFGVFLVVIGTVLTIIMNIGENK